MQKTDSGGFDKRTLMAFALMILVWVAFTQIMPRPKKQEPAPGFQETEEALPGDRAIRPSSEYAPEAQPSGSAAFQERGTGGTSGAFPSGHPVHEPTSHRSGEDRSAAQMRPDGGQIRGLVNILPAEEQEVMVEGARFRAVFTTRGATLKSWQLTEFTDAEDGLVDLVQELPGALGLSIEGPQGTIDLTSTIFAFEESWEELGREPPNGESPTRVRVLRFVAEGQAEEGQPGLRVERIYRIDPFRYDMQMEVFVSGVSNYRGDHHICVSWDRGIPDLETHTKTEKATKAAVALLAEELVKHGFGGGRFGCGCGGGAASKGGEHSYEGILRWAGVRGKYFGAILVPEQEMQAVMVARSEPSRGEVGMRLVLPMEYEGASLYRFTVFAGPIDYTILKELDGRLQRDVIRLVDFGMAIIAPISKGAYWFLNTVHSVVPNYGLVIIILAIFVRLIFHPLNVKALQSQRRMQALKPELDALNAKYKDKPEIRTKKMMELHKKHGVSPLGGCLPMLVQLPVLFALYNVLMNTIDLRKEPFVLWVRDLASPDTVAEVMGIPINILPLLMGLTTYWQQKMTPTDPKQAQMFKIMPLFMVFILYSLPSGLVLYWTMMNLLQIAQQKLMKPITLPAGGTVEEKESKGAKGQKRQGKGLADRIRVGIASLTGKD